MVNETFKKDLNKFVAKTTVSSELAPGAPRRYEPEGGVAKHNDLPFSFSKPTFSGAKKTTIKLCANCDAEVLVHTNAVGVICRSCGKYSSLKEVELNG